MDAKIIPGPDRDFSEKVLKAHDRIYKALAARDAKGAGNAMIRDIKEVQKVLLRIQKEKHIPGVTFRTQWSFRQQITGVGQKEILKNDGGGKVMPGSPEAGLIFSDLSAAFVQQPLSGEQR